MPATGREDRREAPESISAASPRRDAFSFSLLLVVLAGAPVLETWGSRPGSGSPAAAGSQALLELSAFLVAATTVFGSPRRPSRERWARGARAAVAVLAAFGVLQMMPLPERVLEIVAPGNTKLYHDVAGVVGRWGSSAAPRTRISLAPRQTAATLLELAADLALFAASARLATSGLRRRLLALPVWIVASAVVIASIAGASTGERPGALLASPQATVAYLALALALAFGAFWTELLVGRESAAGRPDPQRRVLRLAGWIFLGLFLAVGLALAGSQAGLVAGLVLVACLTAAALWPRRDASSSRRWPAVLLLGLAAAVLVVVAVSGAAARWLRQDLDGVPGRERAAVWSSSLEAWRESPVVGAGLGAFGEAFRRVQPRRLPGRIEQAPSAALDLLVCGGAIGTALVVGLALVSWAHLFAGWKRQRHREGRVAILVGGGALAAVAAICLLVHPASLSVGATAACVVGAGWAAARDR